jgi:hypothetical protein
MMNMNVPWCEEYRVGDLPIDDSLKVVLIEKTGEVDEFIQLEVLLAEFIRTGIGEEMDNGK